MSSLQTILTKNESHDDFMVTLHIILLFLDKVKPEVL